MENHLVTTQDLLTFEQRLLNALNVFSTRVDERFDSIDQRLDKMDARMDAMDRRFDVMDRRLDVMDKRMEGFVSKDEFASAMESVMLAIDHLDRKLTVLISELRQTGALSASAASRVISI